jgi:hypothetical protein
MRRTLALSPIVLFTVLCAPLAAQTIEDGIMLEKGALLTGPLYSQDSWNEYWEGGLKRNNGNIGELTTRTGSWFASYGLTTRWNVIAVVPHVRTHASQGVLHSMSGFQDLTLAAKYSFLEKPSMPIGSLRAIAAVTAVIPMSDYTPDFYPMSIGTAAQRVAGRGTVHLQTEPGLFASGSASYAWRSTVTLDRPFYFTDGRLFLTDTVDMPNVFDYVVNAGYMKRRLMAALMFSQQRTLGGGDIRRQDMPFVSNRMNFSKIGGMLMTPLPKLENLVVQLGYAYTIDGRNVGQSSTFNAGLLFQFRGRRVQ